MKITKATEIKVGLLLFAGFLLLVLVILFGRGINISTGKAEVKFLFPSSAGLKLSDPIYVNGVKRGSVLSIENYKDSVLIKGVLEVTNDIYSDASFQIMILEITGGKKIEINPGTSGIPINTSQFFRGSTPPDLGELIAVFGSASSGIMKTLEKLDVTLTGLNTLFGDSVLLSELKSISKNTNLAVEDLKNILENNKDNLNTSLKDLKSISSDLKSIISNNKENLNTIIENFSTISKDAKPLILKADSLVSSLQILSDDLNSIIKKVENGDGFVSKILFDGKFSARIDSTLYSLDSLVSLIKKYGINVNVRLGSRP
jgi:phospholipid/cholesterol/gamma-HCH transport system substrate-binding protein